MVGLERRYGPVEPLAECGLEDLLLDGAVEPLDEAIGVRMFDLGAGVAQVVEDQVELVE